MKSARRLDITAEAEGDLRSVLEYTLATWGEEREDRYAGRLMHGLDSLRSQPELGVAKDDVRPGLCGLRIGQHVAYYRVLERSIRVERILHVKMDPFRHLRGHK